MNAEPSVPEGLRTLLVFHVTRTRGLVALGLLSLAVGVGIASGIGSAEDGAAKPSPPPVSAAAHRIDSRESSGADASNATEEEASGEVVARYVAVPIDSLPLHRTDSEFQADPVESLVIVTRGEIGAGQSLGSSLRSRGISASTVHLISTEMRPLFDFRRSRPGDRYRLGQDSDARVLDFRYSQGPEESFYLAWDGTRYVTRKETAELRPQIAKIAGIVDSSFYGAVRALGEQSSLASDFARIFAWDVDFSRNVHPGDEFQILYERLYRRDDDGKDVYVRPGRILAGRYAGQVGDHTIVYFEDHEGRGSYFRPDGTSVERAFLAAPLAFSRISSRFTRARYHPILRVTRPHPGIDYAAPHGTPVWAVADGVVEYRARAGASGNLLRIRHANGYTSHYAHLSGFAKGLRIGDFVEQKETIGYVGSTGLSTGPHVCYRVKKDGHYVDPMKISSPAGAAVDPDALAAFYSVRDQLLADLGPGSVSAAHEAL
ncbi:MAG: M23 family metallopeptidase [Deltaproteobacteria bacterium]|jgi:murein DD-endopeptidase MepM/ murein hydrolase activator NlpD|nr:M23 family metallopeptidase [Deltaproteobacteria bacterium]